LDKIEGPAKQLWYIKKTVQNGWSRNVLVHQIESNLHERQALPEKTTNFKNTLPAAQSDLAQEMIKDPYKFDFLSLDEEVKELELEKALTTHMTKFLLELGAGFAFLGRQYHLEIDKKDYYLDLLFYHVKLRCYVVIDLKVGDFKPEYTGKMNFYLSAVDDMLKTKDDNRSIGIILCKTKNKLSVEYALRDTTKPMGIAEYKLTDAIPTELKTNFPTIEEVEKELGSFDLEFKEQ
jgi:predicted nuclease of restriction endonuclease-like (RecB) superfamily